VTIEQENGKVFTVEAKNRTPENPYVQQVLVNGVRLEEPFIDHATIESGATLTFEMGPEKIVFWK
jgi:putative alpha-1,2-mannosidase